MQTNQRGFTPITPQKWSTRSGILTYLVSLPLSTDRSGYMWLGSNESGIIWWPVPLSILPLPGIVGPHQKIRWRKFEYPSQPYPVLMSSFPHRSYTCKQNNEASFPLHHRSDQPNPVFETNVGLSLSICPGFLTLLFSLILWHSLDCSCTNTPRLQRIKVLLS